MQTRVADRLSGILFALLLQAGFLLLLFQSVHVLTVRPQPTRELTFFLPRLTATPSVPLAAPSASAPAIAVPRPKDLVLPAPVGGTPQAGLQGFGESLFGCAPEKYLSMTPEQRGHCPKPGERAQRSDEDELLNPKTHSRDAPLWQESIDERNWAPTECMGNMAFVVECQAQAMHNERVRRDAVYDGIARSHAKAAAAPPPPVPDIGVRRGR